MNNEGQISAVVTGHNRELAVHKPRRIGLPDILIAVLIPLFIALQSSISPIGHGATWYDQAVFIYGASRILGGDTIYVDFWDHKGPMIYLFDVIGLVVGRGHLVGVWIVQLSALIAAAFFSIAALSLVTTRIGARVATVLWLFALIGVYTQGNLTEDYSLLFAFGALWAFTAALKSDNPGIMKHGFAQGLTLMATLLLRANLIAIWIPLFFVSLIISKSRVNFIVGYFLGLTVVLFPFFAYLMSKGAFGEFFDAVWTYNRMYGAAPIVSLIGASIVSERGMWSSGTQLLPILGFVKGAHDVLRRNKVGNKDPNRLFFYFLLASSAILPIAVGASGRPYGHYAMAYMPIIGGWTAYFWQLAVNKKTFDLLRGEKVFAVALCIASGAVPTFQNLQLIRNSVKPAGDDLQTIRIAKYLREHTKPEDKVLTWGTGPQINLLADRLVPHRFFYVHAILTKNWEKMSVAKFADEIRKRPPEIILDVASISDTANSIGKGQYKIGGKVKELVRGFYEADVSPMSKVVEDLYTPEVVIEGGVVYRLKPQGRSRSAAAMWRGFTRIPH